MNTVTFNNLPTQQTSFIGRSDEVNEILSLLSDPDCHLITLVGPGGVGKTRLAVEAARQVMDIFPNGVYFTPLARLNSVSDILSMLIEVTGYHLQQETKEPRLQFLDYLKERHLMLIMDNFEHLLEGAELVSEILNTAPDIKIIATSREPLKLSGEWVRRIGGMAFPEEAGVDTPENYSAVRLFLDRARRVRGTTLQADELASIIRICQLVEGMPLAIELSASWMQTLAPSVIADEVHRNIDILATPLRDISERHRSMRAVFNHSWQLLSEQERDVFQKLSVFCGSFSREAAEVVTGASLHILAALVDKSLLYLNANGRYDIHELLRQYGEAHLRSTEAADEVLIRHAIYFLEMMGQLEGEIKTHQQAEALDQIAAEFENIRTAWYRAVEYRLFESIDRAVESLNFFSDMRSRYLEGERLYLHAIEAVEFEGDPQLDMTLSRLKSRCIRLVLLGGFENDLDIAQMINESLETARLNNALAEIGFCLYLKGIFLMEKCKYWKPIPTQISEQAFALLGESLDCFTNLNDRFYIAEVLTWTASWETGSEKFEQSNETYRRSLELSRAIGDKNGIAWSLFSLSRSMDSTEDHPEAETYLRQSIAMMHEIKSLKGIIHGTHKLVVILAFRGEFEEARRLADEIVQLARTWNNPEGLMLALSKQSFLVSVMEEDYEKARELAEEGYQSAQKRFFGYRHRPFYFAPQSVAACGLGDIDTIRRNHIEIVNPEYYTYQENIVSIVGEAVACAQENRYERATELLGLAFEQPLFNSGWLSRWALVDRLKSELQAALGMDAYDDAWSRGQKLDYCTVLRSLKSDNAAVDDRWETNQALPEPLTQREFEILHLIATGLSNQEIADQLVLSVGTIKVHIRHIYQKLNVSSRTQAIAQASELNLI